jgi:hypothetical protein
MPLFIGGSAFGQRVINGSAFSMQPGAIFLWVLPFALVLILVDPFGLMRPALPEAILRLVMYPLFVVCGFLIFVDGGIQQAIIRQRRAALIDFGRVDDVLARHDQDMRRRGGRNIPERHHIVVLEDKVGRRLALRDFAEDTIGQVLYASEARLCSIHLTP